MKFIGEPTKALQNIMANASIAELRLMTLKKDFPEKLTDEIYDSLVETLRGNNVAQMKKVTALVDKLYSMTK